MMSNQDICCPQFDHTAWNDIVVEWNNKKFIKDKVCTFLYMPLNFGNVIRRLDAKVRDAAANVPNGMCLSEHTSKWNMNLFLAVDNEVPNAENTTISGRFFCKVYEGHFKNTDKWCKDFRTSGKAKGYNLSEKLYMWYTTCPKCAKKYGKNYVVILASITS